jgi:hypothetical protein
VRNAGIVGWVEHFARPNTSEPRNAIPARHHLPRRHQVTDYAAWRKVYDAFDAERRPMGVIGDAVYQSVNDPNDVTVWHDFKTVEQAKAFASWDKLKDTMKNAGVKGPPQIWFTTKAD